jgi:hypothetical protein
MNLFSICNIIWNIVPYDANVKEHNKIILEFAVLNRAHFYGVKYLGTIIYL